jgi:hypothetical protein
MTVKEISNKPLLRRRRERVGWEYENGTDMMMIRAESCARSNVMQTAVARPDSTNNLFSRVLGTSGPLANLSDSVAWFVV